MEGEGGGGCLSREGGQRSEGGSSSCQGLEFESSCHAPVASHQKLKI